MVTTDIILILYGDSSDLDSCVQTIERYCSNYKLHVIDNNDNNTGFTKAVNSGISEGTSPFIWLINQDVLLLEGAQEGLIHRMNYHPKVGVVGSMQVDPKDLDIVRHGGTSRAFPAGAHKGGRISWGDCLIPEKQTWVNFASVMIRRNMVNSIGPLDEKMFLLYSDSDYCYVARKNGWEVWYEPSSRVIHRLGKGSKNISEWHTKDKEAFMEKWGIKFQDGKYSIVSEEFLKLDRFP